LAIYAKNVLNKTIKELITNIVFTFLKCIIIKYAIETALDTKINPKIIDKI